MTSSLKQAIVDNDVTRFKELRKQGLQLVEFDYPAQALVFSINNKAFSTARYMIVCDECLPRALTVSHLRQINREDGEIEQWLLHHHELWAPQDYNAFHKSVMAVSSTQSITDLHTENNKIKEVLRVLTDQLDELYYAPGMPGFIKANEVYTNGIDEINKNLFWNYATQ